MNTLTYISTASVNDLTWPTMTENITIYSPALSVFTDFKTAGPRVIESNAKADVLVKVMKKEHIRMKIVVDESNNFVGIISLEDLSEDALIKMVAEGYRRSELLVSDLMRPKEDLLALSYKSLKNSDIETLLCNQKENSLQHLLVVDETAQTVRGLISSNDIVRQLRLDVDVAFSSFEIAYSSAILGQKFKSRKLRVA